MGLKKGQTNNVAGRPAGSPNRVTTEMKEWVAAITYKNRRQMEKDLKKLEPKDRIIVLERLLQYVIPKQQAMSAQIDFNMLSDEQLQIIINELTNNVNDE